MPYALDNRRGELSEVVQLWPRLPMPGTVARIAAGLEIWQGLPVAYGMPWTLPRAAPGQMKSPRNNPRAVAIRRGLYDRAGRRVARRRVYIS